MYNYLIRLITDHRKKDNNFKIIKIFSSEADKLIDTFKTIQAYQDVDNATGKTLDKLGKEIGLSRGDIKDEIFRLWIKAKRLSITSKGDMNTVIKVLALLLNSEPDEFDVVEMYQENKPARIKVIDVPLDNVLEIGLTGEDLVSLLKEVVAGGVAVEEVRLDGTFQFVKELEIDSDLGFADIEMTQGGTLGAIFGKESR